MAPVRRAEGAPPPVYSKFHLALIGFFLRFDVQRHSFLARIVIIDGMQLVVSMDCTGASVLDLMVFGG